ncbi:SIS domain-containing protein [Actinophytocola sp.]|uniref:D-sedoheptulose-7-phosphate isomerase n=1 Tax=Actinophytocola sp. TaxID=1872138 RepID=UPI003899E3FA
MSAENLVEQLADHVGLARRVEELLPELSAVADLLIRTYERDGRLFTFGNGGSAADAQHLAAELIGRYQRTRRPLPALALTVDPSVLTCVANDFSYEDVFARQVTGFVRPGDMVIAFSTSGRSENVVRGLRTAREMGAVTVFFGGCSATSPAAEHADHALVVDSAQTARIQEMHLLLLHLLSERVDAWAAGEG